ncbi:hypothetical protein Misp06_03212 [Microbulbifer sp. NBRC 101763]|nr:MULTISPECIES: class IIb bacteriocin, lactobin A/cerein 7B family [Microbulbifer]WHI52546.1 class IIb bacteriocin, lactobin A/cerein 7B family [Microbulbifer sp. MLAF003]
MKELTVNEMQEVNGGLIKTIIKIIDKIINDNGDGDAETASYTSESG